MDKPFLVLYSASGKDANAYALHRATLDLPFFVDNKAYAYYTAHADEAEYLAAFLNSDLANEQMKPFQSQGLFGARDVHRKILDLPLPRFDAGNSLHLELVARARVCATAVASYIEQQQLATQEYNVGKVRFYIRQTLLRSEFTAIDLLLRKLLDL